MMIINIVVKLSHLLIPCLPYMIIISLLIPCIPYVVIISFDLKEDTLTQNT